MTTLATTIAALRRKAGLSQDELAKRVGVRRQSVQQWETGTTGPSRRIVPALANVLGVPISVLDPILGVSASATEVQQGSRLIPIETLSHVAFKGGGSMDARIFTGFASVGVEPIEARAVMVEDDSMTPDYLPGDVLILDAAANVQDGDDIVISLPGQPSLLRRYKSRGRNRQGDEVFDLVTPNAESVTITLTTRSAYQIVGVVVELQRKKRRA
jgi:transcriptional regulator with XRE-family HTH domain